MAKFSVLVVTPGSKSFDKQATGAFVRVDQREVLLRALDLFNSRPEVCQVQVCVDEAVQPEAKRRYGAHLSFSGAKLLTGGTSLESQIHAALPLLSPDATHIIIHDGARCLVPEADIENLLAMAVEHGAAGLAVDLDAPVLECALEAKSVAATGLLAALGAPDARSMPSAKGAKLIPGGTHRWVMPLAMPIEMYKGLCKSKSLPDPAAFRFIPGSAINVRISRAEQADLFKGMIGAMPKPKAKPSLNPFEEAKW